MKKKLMIILMALGLVISGCSKGEEKPIKEAENKETEGVEKEEADKKEEKKDQKNMGEVSYEALMEIPPTPLDDFEWSRTPEGDLALGIYKGKDPMVYVGDEYDGRKVVKIGGYAYVQNPYVKAIRLGKNLKYIGFGCFGPNDTLEIFVAEGLEKIDEAGLISASKLRDVRLNEGLKEIGESAFGGCESLRELTIPKSVEKIGKGAFLVFDNEMTVKGYAGTPVKEVAESGGAKYEEIKE